MDRQRERLIDSGVNGIFDYLLKLEREYELPKSHWTLDSELKEPIRKALQEELTGKETAEQVAGIVRRLVREELEI